MFSHSLVLLMQKKEVKMTDTGMRNRWEWYRNEKKKKKKPWPVLLQFSSFWWWVRVSFFIVMTHSLRRSLKSDLRCYWPFHGFTLAFQVLIVHRFPEVFEKELNWHLSHWDMTLILNSVAQAFHAYNCKCGNIRQMNR